MTLKLRPGWSASDVATALQALAALEVVDADAKLVFDAHALAGA